MNCSEPETIKGNLPKDNEILNVKLRYEQSKWDDQDKDHLEGIELEKWSDLGDAKKVS